MLSLLLLTEDGVHEQHFSSVHIWRELGVVHFGFLRLLVTLDKDLADPDGAAAVAETLLHGLTWVEAGSIRLVGAPDALRRTASVKPSEISNHRRLCMLYSIKPETERTSESRLLTLERSSISRSHLMLLCFLL